MNLIKSPKIQKRFLPIQCYGSAREQYRPRPMGEVDGIVQHYFSCIYVKPDAPYDTGLCWQLFHDLNFEPADREFNIYTGPRVGASAHFLIGRDGEILQLVPLEFQAWHAGRSEFNGRPNCNEFMIGIENIGSHGEPFTPAQYSANARLSAWLMDRYGFFTDHIVGHEHVAPGRKKDPGPSFKWQTLFDQITNEMTR